MPKAVETHLANIKIHPAAIVIPCLGVTGIAVNFWQISVSSEIQAITLFAGVGLAGIGFLILYLAYGSMLRAAATINPSEHSSTLVTCGVYGISRNPIYLGWFLFLLGIGIANVSILAISIAVCMIAILNWAVVAGEEEYLERRFGKEYSSYKSRVRRWL